MVVGMAMGLASLSVDDCRSNCNGWGGVFRRGEAAFRCGGVRGGMRRQVGCQEPAGALCGAGGFELQEGLSQPWRGFWRALLGVGCWWSDWETVAGGVWWLLSCRRSEPLPPALADGLDGRGRARDGSRPDEHA